MNIRFERNKTSTLIVMYSLYLYFLGLSLRNTSKALVIFNDEKRSYVSVWNWIQRFGSLQVYKRKRIAEFINETIIQIGSQHSYLLIVPEHLHKTIFEYTFLRLDICLLLDNKNDFIIQLERW